MLISEAPYEGVGGGGVGGERANKWISAKKEANRAGTEEGLGRRKFSPSPVSGTLLLNVLSQRKGGSFIFFLLIKVLTQLTPCTERN